MMMYLYLQGLDSLTVSALESIRIEASEAFF